MSEYRRPVNTSRHRSSAQKWWADDMPGSAYVILVSRGEPRRTDEQMYDIVRDEVRAWQARFNPDDPAEIVELVTAGIASAYIYPMGSQSVRIYRDLLQSYIDKARAAR
jgi:hypothetical protein